MKTIINIIIIFGFLLSTKNIAQDKEGRKQRRQKIKELEMQLKEYRWNLLKFEQLLNYQQTANQKISDLEQKNESIKQRVTNLQKQLKIAESNSSEALSERVNKLEKTIENKDKNLSLKDSEIKRFKNEIKNLKSEIAFLEKNNPEKLIREKALLEKKFQEAKNKLKILEDIRQNLVDEMESVQNYSINRISELELENDLIKAKNITETELKNYKKYIKELEDKLEQSGISTKELRDKHRFVVDSLAAETNNLSLTVVERDSLTRARENALRQEIAFNEQQKKLAEEKTLRYILLFVGLGLVMFALILFFYRDARVRNKQKKAMELKNVELTEKSTQLEVAYNEVTDSLRYAKRIQEAIVPSLEIVKKSFPDIFVLYRPKEIVSGDFYWFTEISSAPIYAFDAEQASNPAFLQSFSGSKQIIAAIDCTGHGVPGAFMTVMGNALLNEIVNDHGITEADQILYELDKKLISTLQKQNKGNTVNDGMDLAMLVFEENKVHFVGAKNPLYYVRDGEMKQIKGSPYPIGNVSGDVKKVFEKHTIKIQRGDIFYIFSDGFQDQFGGKKGKKYMTKRYRNLLHKLSKHSLKEQKEKLSQEFDVWKGNMEQTDDILVIGIKA